MLGGGGQGLSALSFAHYALSSVQRFVAVTQRTVAKIGMHYNMHRQLYRDRRVQHLVEAKLCQLLVDESGA